MVAVPLQGAISGTLPAGNLATSVSFMRGPCPATGLRAPASHNSAVASHCRCPSTPASLTTPASSCPTLGEPACSMEQTMPPTSRPSLSTSRTPGTARAEPYLNAMHVENSPLCAGNESRGVTARDFHLSRVQSGCVPGSSDPTNAILATDGITHLSSAQGGCLPGYREPPQYPFHNDLAGVRVGVYPTVLVLSITVSDDSGAIAC